MLKPVLKKSVLSKVMKGILGDTGSLVEVIETYTFGYRVPKLEGSGGYSSSEVWVIDHPDEPDNNLLSGVRFTAGKNDRITTAHIGSLLTQAELDAGSKPIAQIGLYRADTLALVHAEEFRGKEAVGYFWNDVPFEVSLEEGVTYLFGVSVNGWTNWPEFNPDVGGSTVYSSTTAQILEDLGGLSSRASSWMVPLYFTVERTLTTPTTEYLANLNGEGQYWMLSEPMVLAAGDTLAIKFQTSEDMTNKYFLDGREFGNTAYLIINDTGGWDWSNAIASVVVDGVAVTKYEIFTSSDGLPHEVVATFATDVTLDKVGISQWVSNWFAGAIVEVIHSSGGNVLYQNRLTNLSMGGAQEPEIGNATMIMDEYSPTVWVAN